MADSSQHDPIPGILVVDDSRLIRVAAKKILKDSFHVIEAEDGEAAWQALLDNPDLHVVMSDLSMPNLDGLGLLARIRAADDRRLKDLPVIIATGAEDDDGSKEQALSAGANNFITKPFDAAQLLANAKSLYQQQQTALALHASESTNSELKSQVSIDLVTGAYNRKAFEQRGEEQLAYAVRHHTELALLGIQLDKYKIHFLRRGKVFAEKLLKQFAECLADGRRREDTLAHFSHGEFAVLLPSSDPIGTRNLAENLRRKIEQQVFLVDGEQLQLTASIGVACPVLRNDTKFTDLLEDVHQKLRTAEHAGGNQVKARDNPLHEAHDEKTPHGTGRTALPGEVSQALNALKYNAGIKTDADALMRAILPLLNHWNQQHGGAYSASIETIYTALGEHASRDQDTPAETGHSIEPA